MCVCVCVTTMWLIFVFVICSLAQGLERRLTYSSNPGCEEYNISVSYIKAVGPNDTLHYIWDFTGKPTLFLAVTDLNVTLHINCVYFFANNPNSFNFTETPKYLFSLILSKVIEFDDANDTGILTSATPQTAYESDSFKWEKTNALNGSTDGRFVGLTMTGRDYQNALHSLTGNITLQMSAFGFESHDEELPRLLHSPNSTQCKVIMENLRSNSGYNNSRFAVELIMVSSDDRHSSSKILLRKNLDDENSPGIFSMVDVLTPGAQNLNFRGAFLQWRPIMYVDKVASIGNSSEVITYNLTNVTYTVDGFSTSLPYKFYGANLSDYLIQQIVVSLGTSQDGFYKKTNYSSWTFLLSYGSPELERFSLLVILVMCIGLGLPALLMIVGGAYMCARRIRRKKDELSLER